MTKLATMWQGGSNFIGIQRQRKPFVRAAKEKGVYGRYHSVLSNLATLKPVTEVMQRNAYVGRLYSDTRYILY